MCEYARANILAAIIFSAISLFLSPPLKVECIVYIVSVEIKNKTELLWRCANRRGRKRKRDEERERAYKNNIIIIRNVAVCSFVQQCC